MGNKSSTSGQIISLPKGGGALHGIGEKFSPDLHTGTGNFTVPIALPPGRNGFQPQLSLVYSTGNGNGPFGLGWSLSIPGVSRKTSKGIPQYRDNSTHPEEWDTFILSGAEDLVLVREEKNAGPDNDEIHRSYRPRTEGLFARIKHIAGNGKNYWEISSKDGLVSIYGKPGTAGNNSAVVADPVNRTKIFAWKLTQTVDPFGNRIEYLYEREAIQTDGSHNWDQLYLSEIRYVDYGKPDNPQFLVRVKFVYEERPDPFSEYRAGFEIRTVQRCTTIEVYTHTGVNTIMRTYHFDYLDKRGLPQEQLPHNGVSLLSQIRVVGHDGDLTEELPPLEFGYTYFEPEGRNFFSLEGHLPAQSLASPDLELADLFGNGLPNILEIGSTVRYWRNLGGGQFDFPREMQDAPAGLRLADPGVQLIDADGDGRIDLLATINRLCGYFPLRFGGMWDRRSFQRYDIAPSFNLEDPEVRMIDLDGDGVTDAIRSGNRLECFFSDPKKGWNGTRWIERRSMEEFPNVNFSDPRVKWGDMSGDGLQDIVLVYDGNVEYWPNLGYGNWGKRIHMYNSPRFPYGYDPKRILVGDVDGDGLSDIVYVDDNSITLWINQSGNGWSPPAKIQGTPPISDMDSVRLVDLHGSGISGILWSKDAPISGRDHYFYLDLTDGIKPYLLDEMDNNIGSVTRVEYKPSTYFYLEDQKQPGTRWKTPLPFPVQVVACVEAIDKISKGKLTTEYSYHHGYWDGADREFRGFGRVDQRDTETFDRYNVSGLHDKQPFVHVESKERFSPPLETRTWFHQGPIGDEFGEWEETDFSGEFWSGDPQRLFRPESMTQFVNGLQRRNKRDALRVLRGRILRTELYARDGLEQGNRPYTVTEYLQGLREESPPSRSEEKRQRLFFPYVMAQRVTQWERGTDPMTQFSFTEHYDDCGQLIKQTQIACPRGWQGLEDVPGTAYLAMRTLTEYALPTNPSSYIRDRIAKTTTYEIENDGMQTVLTLKDTADNINDFNVIGQTLNYYDGLPFQGLPFSRIDDHGAIVRTETLILTENILQTAYSEISPPFLAAFPAWTPEYPQEFRNLLKPQAGYVFYTGNPNDEHVHGYFAVTGQQYDFHNSQVEGRGLPVITQDASGQKTKISYDKYQLLPTEVTDPAKMTVEADYDYRTLQLEQVIDPNGNCTRYTYTPFGLLKSTAIIGRPGENKIDTDQAPSMRFEYNFLAFKKQQQPISVRTIQRVHHFNDADLDQLERDLTIETVKYSDGFGRLLQMRTRAEDITFSDSPFGDASLLPDQSTPNQDAIGRLACPGSQPNVVVSGWQNYDNKGRVIEKYEPFFACGWDYQPPTNTEKGQRAEIFYDPRGQVTRTVKPDRSEQRVIYGVPIDLADPLHFMPTPWEITTYDENDNAGRTHYNDALDYQHHWNTPSSAEVDALGRTIKTIKRKGTNPAEWYTSEFTYDIRDNLLTVRDALGRLAYRYVYDLTPKGESGEKEQSARLLRIEQLDAGVQRLVFDAAGNEIERRDSKDALILQTYDIIHRPTRLWARDQGSEPVTLRERLAYGDGGDIQQFSNVELEARKAKNLLGELHKHYDEAGLLSFESYDFKGNVLEKVRQVINDAAIFSVFDLPPPDWEVKAFRVDWQPPAGTTLEDHATDLLDATPFHISFTYDALNRVKMMRYPQDVDGERKVLRPKYNRAGALESIQLDGIMTYVKHIAYNAKGQRTLIAYGNGVMTRYTYDPKTFRLVRLRSERYTMPALQTYHPTGAALQDFAYDYDLVGNILRIRDRTPDCGIPNTLQGNNALDRVFTYDPLDRLLTASGRECDIPPSSPPWQDTPKCHDVALTRPYHESYTYDPVGNMIQLIHTAGQGSFSRNFTLVPNANRLQKMTVGGNTYEYAFDANGNMIGEGTSRHFEWDHSNRKRVFRNQVGESHPTLHAHYLYDSDGERVKKLVYKQQTASIEVTVYIDEIFEYHRCNQGAAQENNYLHLMDEQKRIVLVRVGEPLQPNGATPSVQYHFADHLGSSNIVISENGAWIKREEFSPYGEVSFGGFATKRYRFTGKERDQESSLSYHGARYYAPWLARWVSTDPANDDDYQSEYRYCNNNPIVYVDKDGMRIGPTIEQAQERQELFHQWGRLMAAKSNAELDMHRGGEFAQLWGFIRYLYYSIVVKEQHFPENWAEYKMFGDLRIPVTNTGVTIFGPSIGPAATTAGTSRLVARSTWELERRRIVLTELRKRLRHGQSMWEAQGKKYFPTYETAKIKYRVRGPSRLRATKNPGQTTWKAPYEGTLKTQIKWIEDKAIEYTRKWGPEKARKMIENQIREAGRDPARLRKIIDKAFEHQ